MEKSSRTKFISLTLSIVLIVFAIVMVYLAYDLVGRYHKVDDIPAGLGALGIGIGSGLVCIAASIAWKRNWS